MGMDALASCHHGDPTQVRAVHHNIQSCPYKLERLQLFQHVLLCLSLKFQLTISAAVSCT